jgi:hypothetical protein
VARPSWEGVSFRRLPRRRGACRGIAGRRTRLPILKSLCMIAPCTLAARRFLLRHLGARKRLSWCTRPTQFACVAKVAIQSSPACERGNRSMGSVVETWQRCGISFPGHA